MPRQRYPTDPSNGEWVVVEALIPAPLPVGRSPRHARREIVDAIAYVLRTGRQARGTRRAETIHRAPLSGSRITAWWFGMSR